MKTDSLRRWEQRHRSDDTLGAPSQFVEQALGLLTGRTSKGLATHRALDLACGSGRHALLLAEHGYEVDAVDYALPALTKLKRAADTRGLAIHCLAVDVTSWTLPSARYDLVLVVNFLDRSLFDHLRAAVVPGGALLYQTFRRHESTSATPTMRPDFLLAPGELDELCRGWRVLSRHEDITTHHGNIVARAGILAQRPIGDPPAIVTH